MSSFLLSLLACLLFSSVPVLGGDDCNEGDLRIAEGPNKLEGRVEVCLEDAWRRWCSSSINDAETSVACMQLGSKEGTAFSTPIHGSGSSQNFVSDISCSGEELSFSDCNYTTMGSFLNCKDVALACADDLCGDTFETSETPVRLSNSTSPTEGLLEICFMMRRAGVCYEDIDQHTASLLCNELGFDIDSPGIVADEARHFWTLKYNCTGFSNISQCSQMAMPVQNCSNVRLNCSAKATDLNPSKIDLNLTSATPAMPTIAVSKDTPSFATTGVSTTTVDTMTISTSRAPTLNNDQLVTILVAVCAVLGILLIVGVILFIAVLCLKRGKSSQVTKEEGGISNINYELSGKVQPPKDDERTVHNSLYKRQEIPVAPTTATASTRLQSSSPSPLHVYDYASVGIGSDKNPQLPDLDIPQHTLLLHSGNSDTGGSHTYSKPTTPSTNYDVTTGNFMPHSPGNHSQARDYSKLNSSGDHNHTFSHSQCSDMDESQYSHIDEAHQYSKLSESNSKGYSQLSLGEIQANPCLTEHHELAQPYENPLSASSAYESAEHQVEDPAAPQLYECPVSPAENQDKEGGAENHNYTTLTVEPADTGYSKLHVFEGSQNSAS